MTPERILQIFKIYNVDFGFTEDAYVEADDFDNANVPYLTWGELCDLLTKAMLAPVTEDDLRWAREELKVLGEQTPQAYPPCVEVRNGGE